MRKYLTILYSTTLLVACSTAEDPILPSPTPGDGLVAIAFVPNLSDQEITTRATLYPLEQDFVVSGYKMMGEEPRQLVFDEVLVSYIPDATNNPYDYVSSDPENPQYYRYWDSNASEYRFWAYSSTGITPTYAESSDVVTMSVGTASTPISELEDLFYSEIKQAIPDDYINKDKKVTLVFRQLFTKVELRFWFSSKEPLSSTDPRDIVNLTNIKFAPTTTDKIAIQGKVQVHYPLTGDDPKETITWPEGTLQNMLFDDVVLDHNHQTKGNAVTAQPTILTGTESSIYTVYPTIPPGTSFRLSLEVDGVLKSADIPAERIGWQENSKYTYNFKIEDKDPILYEVKVEPWLKGGEQDLEFKNW